MVEVAVGSDGVPLGYVQLAIHPMSDSNGFHRMKIGETYIEQISVSKAARGKGIGRMLLEKAEARARAAGSTFMSLEVLCGNPAIHLYERFGFKIVPKSKCEHMCEACILVAIMGRPYGCCNSQFGTVLMEKRFA